MLAFDGVVAFELGIPCEVFPRVRTPDGRAAYSVAVAAERPRIAAGMFDICAAGGLDVAESVETLIVPGLADPEAPPPEAVVRTVRLAARRGVRIASICTGSFVLAEAGVLDGRRATTHWAAAPLFAARFPSVALDPNVLFVDEGLVVTSAGASAGLDMCLHLIGRDLGQAAAAQAARLAVAPLNRPGAQAQHLKAEAPPWGAGLAELLHWMLQDLGRPMSAERLARQAGLSPRTLARRFQEQTGTTPGRWLQRERVRRAQELLETSKASIDSIALESGFGSAVTLRACFRRCLGVSPREYRRWCCQTNRNLSPLRRGSPDPQML